MAQRPRPPGALRERANSLNRNLSIDVPKDPPEGNAHAFNNFKAQRRKRVVAYHSLGVGLAAAGTALVVLTANYSRLYCPRRRRDSKVRKYSD